MRFGTGPPSDSAGALLPAALAVTLAWGTAPPAAAHRIVLPDELDVAAVVRIDIEGDVIRTEIEATVPDLMPFSDAFPEQFRKRIGLEPEAEELRHRRFFTEGMPLAADGELLRGQVVSFETRNRAGRDGTTGRRVPLTKGSLPFAKPVAWVTMIYVIEDRPKALTITPPSRSDRDRAPFAAFVVSHLGVVVGDPAVLSRPETVDLDWEKPRRSRFRNPQLGRRSGASPGDFLGLNDRGEESLPRPVPVPAPRALRIILWMSRLALVVMGLIALRSVARAAGGEGRWDRVALLVAVTLMLAFGSRALAGKVSLDEGRAMTIVAPLLHNVGIAANAGDDEAARRAVLERSIASQDAVAVFSRMLQRLDLTDQGGVEAAVTGVELTAFEAVIVDRSIEAQCAWSFEIAAWHWGHSHRRLLPMAGVIRVEVVGGAWRITELRPVGEPSS
jgi:hypothetical protein